MQQTNISSFQKLLCDTKEKRQIALALILFGFYPLDLYEETCHRICRVLGKVIKPDLKLVIATTTPTLHGDHQDILLYNDVLKKVAAEEGATINDLYAIVAADKERMIGEDHIHLSPTGIEIVAEQTARVLRGMLKQ